MSRARLPPRMFWALSTSTMNLFGRIFPKVVECLMSEGENLAARAAPVTARSGRKIEAMGGAMPTGPWAGVKEWKGYDSTRSVEGARSAIGNSLYGDDGRPRVLPPSARQ